jgi:hypothetical protein
LDSHRFDSLVKSFARGANRRAVLKGLLGLGAGAAIAAPVLHHETDAARRPTPTPKPVKCPQGQQWNGVECHCISGETCGSDCCLIGSECCDSACCFGHCYGEELCCSYDDWCAATEECCLGGTVCDGECGCMDEGECCSDASCPEGFDCCNGQCCASGFCAGDICCALGACGNACLTSETQVCCDETIYTGACCVDEDCGECGSCDDHECSHSPC